MEVAVSHLSNAGISLITIYGVFGKSGRSEVLGNYSADGQVAKSPVFDTDNQRAPR